MRTEYLIKNINISCRSITCFRKTIFQCSVLWSKLNVTIVGTKKKQSNTIKLWLRDQQLNIPKKPDVLYLINFNMIFLKNDSWIIKQSYIASVDWRSLQSKILVLSFCMLKNNVYALETLAHHKKFKPGSIFCIFASVASILIGKDEEHLQKKSAHQIWYSRLSRVTFLNL